MGIIKLYIRSLLCTIVFTTTVYAQAPYVLVLGVAQDGGFPQAGCSKSCCKEAWKNLIARKFVSYIAIINPATKQSWLVDATPDFAMQLELLRVHLNDSNHIPSGIFLTHAHIGHYAGLDQLGREVMGTKSIPVYAMPRMFDYLKSNGPWSQLVKLQNIDLRPIQANVTTSVMNGISFTPFLVPHRDEFSETVGYGIQFANSSALYIPDIDKWEKWYTEDTPQKMDSLFSSYSYILIDGTFNASDELGEGRMKDIPHPFVEESVDMFNGFDNATKHKIYFIHLNHTNPLLQDGAQTKQLYFKGFRVAKQGDVLK